MGKVFRTRRTALKRNDVRKVRPDALASDPHGSLDSARGASVFASVKHVINAVGDADDVRHLGARNMIELCST
jgi:hypothetical protein